MSTFAARFIGYSVLSLSALVAASLSSAPAKAATVNLGGNWQATWDGSLDPFVNVSVVNITSTAIFITKTANFNQPPNPDGSFNTIPILFSQTGASTITDIVIENEVITNNSGVAWNGFRMDILGGQSIATFDVASTAASGGPAPIGFAISPFTTATFVNNQRLDIGGGIVANGGQWLPGSGANGGQLWINVTSQAGAPFSTFTLKETPLPEPGAMALLAIAGVLVGGRKRRRK